MPLSDLGELCPAGICGCLQGEGDEAAAHTIAACHAVHFPCEGVLFGACLETGYNTCLSLILPQIIVPPASTE